MHRFIAYIMTYSIMITCNSFFTDITRKFQINVSKLIKKSHTCEEGGAHLRISDWHLLVNLKSNYLVKKLLKWTNKKCMNFEFTMMYLKKKKRLRKHLEISLFYTSVPKILIIWSTVLEI